MAETSLNLYTAAALSHTGTEDSGNGVALPVPTPGLANWYQYGNPPSGWSQAPMDGWAHGGYLYLLYNGTNGLGRGIYRFTQNQTTGALTYDSFVAIAATGLVGNRWTRGSAQYDSSDGSVILISYKLLNGTGYSPICKKWLSSSWPFTNSNHEWSSPLAQSYASYVAGQLTNIPYPYLGANYLFLSNNYSGQVFMIDPSDGSVLGPWVYYGVFDTVSCFKILGENSSGQLVGGSYHASGGNKAIHKWDISTPSGWVSAGPLLASSAANIYAPNYKRGGDQLWAQGYYTQPLSASEKALLGLTGCVYWQNVRYSTFASEMFLVHYDPDLDIFREIPFAQDSGRRSMGNYRFTHNAPSISRFVSVNGIPWFVGWTIATADIENDNPGGRSDRQIGLILSAVGPGTCKYTVPAPADGDPKRISIEIPTAAKNYLHSEAWAKHGFRFQIAGGGWTNWRYGVQALSNLDSVVGGLAAWGSFAAGESLEIEHRMTAGWPYASDASVVRNPGEAGDPAVETVGTADAAPPREVVIKLWYDGPVTYHTLIGVEAEVTLDPYPLGVAVEVE